MARKNSPSFSDEFPDADGTPEVTPVAEAAPAPAAPRPPAPVKPLTFRELGAASGIKPHLLAGLAKANGWAPETTMTQEKFNAARATFLREKGKN